MASSTADTSEPAEDAPSNNRLGERITRLEEKQDHLGDRLETRTDVIESKIDRIADCVDELESDHSVVEKRNAKIWTGIQVIKWSGPALAGSGILVYAVQLVA